MVPVLVAILLTVNAIVLTAHAQTKVEFRTQEKSLSETRNALESRSKALQEVSKQKTTIDASLREERVKSQNLQTENESLKVSLQARQAQKAKEAEQARIAAEKPKVQQQVSQPAIAVTGNKASWLAASGIPQSEWGYVDFLVTKEAGWNPCAYNPSQSDCSANPTSACGLAQSLPCGKQSVYGHWTDPVANLKWQYDYVKGRYGGYAGAVAQWQAKKWY